MHSSRMRTAHFNGHLWEGVSAQGVCVQGVCVSRREGVYTPIPRGRHPPAPLHAEIPPPHEQNDRQA